MKQLDRYAKDISEKLDNMFPTIPPPTSPTANNNYSELLKNAKDDNYYLERNLEPPRFELYKIARKLMIEAPAFHKRPFFCYLFCFFFPMPTTLWICETCF